MNSVVNPCIANIRIATYIRMDQLFLLSFAEAGKYGTSWYIHIYPPNAPPKITAITN